MKLNIFKILIKSSLVIIGILGIIFTVLYSGFMSRTSAFLYFTVQSNITIIAISMIFLVDDLRMALGKDSFITQRLYLFKYVFTVAITITFLVFVTLLAPTLPVSYLLSFNNFSLHVIVPLLAITDFFLFDEKIKLTKVNCLLSTAMPLYYLVFVFIGLPLGFDYGNGTKVPYFFLNYEQLGWFTFDKGIGVFYWIILLLIFIIGLGYLFYFLMKLRQRKS